MDNDLLVNLDKINTTELGIGRIKKNPGLNTEMLSGSAKKKQRRQMKYSVSVRIGMLVLMIA